LEDGGADSSSDSSSGQDLYNRESEGTHHRRRLFRFNGVELNSDEEDFNEAYNSHVSDSDNDDRDGN
jgi:hypothetical protein